MRNKTLLLATMALTSTFVAKAAEMYDGRAALADASRHVTENKSAVLRASRARTKFLETLGLERFYKTGDRWTVAVSHVSHGMVQKNDEDSARQTRFLAPKLFEFRVVDSAPEGSAQIEVLPISEDGRGLTEGRVAKLVLRIDRELRIVAKEYHYRGLGEPVVAASESNHNAPQGFEAFPIDLPDFGRARILPFSPLTASRVASPLAKHARRTVDPHKSIRFESPDLFSRSIRVTWQHGDLWPAYLETNSGHSILIKQDKL